MKNIMLCVLAAGFIFSGCLVPKSPEAVDQEMSGSYKRTFDGEKPQLL